MKMTMKTMILSLLVMVGTVTTVLAQTATPRTNARQASQRARIAEGRQSGELTNKEAAALNAQQRHIRRAERRAKADGEVTVAERARLERKQDRASRNIRRAKNNAADKN
jgi:hypothetical protein